MRKASLVPHPDRNKNFLYRALFFAGWLLSPLTFWNDAFVNIPISYLSAHILVKIFAVDFAWTVVIFYWLTNVVGVLLMYVAGVKVFKNRREIIIQIIAILIYSCIVIILNRIGVLRPLF